LTGQTHDSLPGEFWQDREKRFGMDRKIFLPAVPHMQAQFLAGTRLLLSSLEEGRQFVAGDAPGHADFALFMNVRFVQLSGTQPADLGSEIAAWYERISIARRDERAGEVHVHFPRMGQILAPM
jgi:glutathione S-transferase